MEVLLKVYASSWLAAAMLVVGMNLAVIAQEPPAPPPPTGDMMFLHGPGPMGEMHGMGEGKVVTGAPLTAEISTTRDTILADGNRIHKETQTKLYRDSQGRVRREMTVDLNTPMTGAARHTMIMINDPVSGHHYMLNPDNKTAHEMPVHGKGKGPHPFLPGDGPKYVPSGKAPNVQEQQLGTKDINGVAAEGTRVTRTIAAGEIGNDKPIEVVTERWFSKDLQLPVLTTHTDPMMGTVTTKLTNVTRGEPDASLFQLPSDYKVVQGHGGEPMRIPVQP